MSLAYTGFSTYKTLLLYIGCTCNAEGSETAACDTAGKCTCKPNVVGADCDKCAEGYFGFPDCQGKFSHKVWAIKNRTESKIF